ncbi:MAG: LCP family protein, partial [bacterium]
LPPPFMHLPAPAIIIAMDDRFRQLNKLLQEEIARQRAGAMKKWLWPLITFCLLFFIFSIFLAASGRSPVSQGKIIIKKTGANLKAAAASAADILLPSSFSEPKNILILGTPGAGNDAPDLTDTIILAHLNGGSMKANLVSVPRDLFVKIPDSQQYSKINSLYSFGKNSQSEEYGLSLIVQKVEEITSQKIDYYFLVDLSVVKQIIDELGGINVMVQKDIVDKEFPGPNHSYQTFELKAGWRYLDGETALKYIRSRHSLSGDFDRIARQQQVIEALKQKLMGLNPVFDLPPLIRVAEKLWKNVKTNIPFAQLPQFWQLAKKISPDNISKTIIDGNESQLLVSKHMMFSDGEGYVLEPKAGLENYSEIQKFLK